MLCVAYVCCVFIVSSPSSLSVDPGTDLVPETDAAQETDYTVDEPSFAAELPSKQNPLDHFDIAHSLLSYACIRNYCCYCYPILMHSLFIVTCY